MIALFSRDVEIVWTGSQSSIFSGAWKLSEQDHNDRPVSRGVEIKRAGQHCSPCVQGSELRERGHRIRPVVQGCGN